MTNKEAIYKLIQFRRILEKGVFPVGYRFDAEPFDMAIDALEKQESKKPLKMKDCKLRSPYSCPECYTEIPPGCEYCWRCGKKIDWSKEEDD